jgi:CMP-N-acetylneuraminic acid synthetase
LAYAGDIVRDAGYFDRAVVSTDHPKIAEVAQSAGLAAPFFRPEELSGDRVADFPVLKHALLEMEEQDRCQYDVVVMLQPTCPLRKVEHVTETVACLIDGDWDAVWTVSPTDIKYHPLKTLKIGSDGTLALYDPRGKTIVARQQLDPIFHRNGAAYAFSRQALLASDTTLPEHSSAVVIQDLMISIDTLDDFATIERVLLSQCE